MAVFEDYQDSPKQLAQCASSRRQTRREQLQYRRQQLASELAAIDKALAALDAHPELEEFIETLAHAGA